MKNTGNIQIARRYVKALFDVAEQGKAIPSVEKDLASLAAALSQSDELRDFLSNPLLARDEQAKALSALLSKIGAHAITQQFIAMLADNKRLALLSEIAQQFLTAAATARGEMKAHVTSSAKLSPNDIAAIAATLQKAYGKKVNVEASEDQNLIGGVVVKIGGLQIDGSVAGKLQRLKNLLKVA